VPALRDPGRRLIGDEESPAAIASGVELILEGLHLSKRLNKESVAGRSQYRGR
jgi:magnesium chelatase subunit I